MVIVGMGQDTCQLNTGAVVVKELDIHGCFRYTNTVGAALCLLSCLPVSGCMLLMLKAQHAVGHGSKPATCIRCSEQKIIS